jgi:hypothetical protein
MGRFITGLFAGKQTSPPATSLRVSTALQGQPIALLLGGQARMSVNVMDYFGFSSSGGSGGKGGTSGKGQGTTYNASVVLGICEGPVLKVVADWWSGTKNYFDPNLITPDGGPEAFYAGDYQQTPWPFSTAFDPTHALAYRGICYFAFSNLSLGNSPNLPQINLEILALNNSNIVPGQPDGDPTLALAAFLTNQYWGVGFPVARLAPLSGTPSTWQSYCKALGFGVSPVISAAVSAASAMGDLVNATNSAACWQDGLMHVVPYGDAPVSLGQINSIIETHIVPALLPNAVLASITIGNVGNFVADFGVTYFAAASLTLVPYPPTQIGTYSQMDGTYYFTQADINNEVSITYTYAAAASYVPDTVPLYDFTINDFLTNQGSVGTGLAAGNSPVVIVRKPRDQMLNNVKVEYLDRNNAYNPVDIEVKDSASIYQFKRVRPGDIKQFHFFCLASAAVQSCTLQLVREQIARTFQFTCGKHFSMILSLMKIVTLTLPSMRLAREPVRIIEISENTDQTLTVTCEEFNGTAAAPIYGSEASLGHQTNYNATPGFINTPLIFEPTDELGRAMISGGGLLIAIALSGEAQFWGGCNAWISYDGSQYTEVATVTKATRMGVLMAPLPTAAVNPTGAQTIDTTSVCAVNLTESNAQLVSVSQIDANSLNTKSFIGPLAGQPGAGAGEAIAYMNATLVATSEYDLTYLIRGAFGTETDVQTWPTGTGFARIDENVLLLPYDKSRIGSTIFLKFPSFNLFSQVTQSLADVPAYSYTIQGIALASPLPILENVRTVIQNGRLAVAWDEIVDFRGAIRVEIRQGTTYNSAVILGTVAHPAFILPGDGTYWFTAWCQPASGLIVRSEAPVSVTAVGATVLTNVVASYDAKAAGWPGTFVNTSVDLGINAVRLNGGQLTTSGPTAAGNNVLNFASVPPQVVRGQTVSDVTDSGVIPAGTTVLSVTSSTVTISNPIGSDFSNVDFPAEFGSRGVLAGDVIQFGTLQILTQDGTYQPPFTVDVKRPTAMTITISLQGTGLAVGQNILADTDILGDTDVLGSVGAQFVNVHASILLSQDGVTYAAPIKYSPGDYFGRAAKFIFNLSSVDPNTIAYLLTAQISVQVQARDDHILTNGVLPAAGLTVAFTPDGSATPAPFNGGPNGATVPHILATWGSQQPGDVFSIVGLTAAGAFFQIVNGGVGVARGSVNIIAEGF